MKYIGIDPGLQGGIAILEDNNVTLYPMPLIGDKDYDVQAIKDIFHSNADADLCGVERQQSMPGQGLSSTFKTGMGFGILLGVLSALGLRYEVVPPQTWQRRLFVGLKQGQDTKVSSEIIAKRLFPTTSFLRTARSHKASDGLTDAACIAEFIRRTYGHGVQLHAGRDHNPNPHNADICLSCGAHIPTADTQCFPLEK